MPSMECMKHFREVHVPIHPTSFSLVKLKQTRNMDTFAFGSHRQWIIRFTGGKPWYESKSRKSLLSDFEFILRLGKSKFMIGIWFFSSSTESINNNLRIIYYFHQLMRTGENPHFIYQSFRTRCRYNSSWLSDFRIWSRCDFVAFKFPSLISVSNIYHSRQHTAKFLKRNSSIAGTQFSTVF